MTAIQKASEDQSKYYLKSPQEMSRFEIAELEEEFRLINEPEIEQIENDETLRESPEFEDFKQQVKNLQPYRHKVIKQYFDKYRYHKKKREMLFAKLEESETFAKQVLRDEYVHYFDAMPEMKKFVDEIELKEKKREDLKIIQKAEEEKNLLDPKFRSNALKPIAKKDWLKLTKKQKQFYKKLKVSEKEKTLVETSGMKKFKGRRNIKKLLHDE